MMHGFTRLDRESHPKLEGIAGALHLVAVAPIESDLESNGAQFDVRVLRDPADEARHRRRRTAALGRDFLLRLARR